MKKLRNWDIHHFEEMIAEARKTVITVHMRPDGDAVGSGMAMLSFLHSLGRQATLLLPHSCPASASFLIVEDLQDNVITCESDIKAAQTALQECDLIICEDFNDLPRAGDIENVLESSTAKKILIDHHIGPNMDKFDMVISDTTVSSTAELLYDILIALPAIDGDAKKLPALTATALMTGMISDTNNFANSTSPETLKMASALIAAGVDRDAIIGHLYNSFSENRLRLMARLLKDMVITPDGIAYMILNRKMAMAYDIHDSDTEGFVNLPLSIQTVRMSIFLKQDKDRFRVSIRSKHGVSANIFARKYFHGGGHELAAGGRLMFHEDIDSPRDAASYIDKVTHEYFAQNE